jgi:hypothetical protein
VEVAWRCKQQAPRARHVDDSAPPLARGAAARQATTRPCIALKSWMGLPVASQPVVTPVWGRCKGRQLLRCYV